MLTSRKPDDVYTVKTERAISQFQRDYMGIQPTGKICGNTLRAIDEFSERYKERVDDYKCPCQNSNNSTEKDKANVANRCPEGWGKGLFAEQYMDSKISEAHRKYEYPGMHRSTLWAVSAVKFYLDHTQSHFKKMSINRGYRCWADNNFHSRKSTNHFGKAADIWFTKKGARTQSESDMNELRSTIFNKYLNAKWWNNPNFFTLEKSSDGASTYVHVDCRDFELKYHDNKFHIKQQSQVIGKSIIEIAKSYGFADTCNCNGKVALQPRSIQPCTNCKVFDKQTSPKERMAFYEKFVYDAVNCIESKGQCNKFKGLYFVAQRRQENGFNLKSPGNNPMNIMGHGDLGQVEEDSHETINGKYVPKREKFANFSSEEKGFEGYLDLLSRNFNQAYLAVLDDSKSIQDFVDGLEDHGRKGSYATGKPDKVRGLTGPQSYKRLVKENFNSTLSDLKKWYQCKLNCPSYAAQQNQLVQDIKLLNSLL